MELLGLGFNSLNIHYIILITNTHKEPNYD